MTIKNLDKFKEFILEGTILPQAKAYAAATGLSEKEMQDVLDVYEELGFTDFLLNNTHKLILTDEQFQFIIDKSIETAKLQKEVKDFVGEATLQELLNTSVLKEQQWWQSHEEIFVEKLQDKLYSKTRGEQDE